MLDLYAQLRNFADEARLKGQAALAHDLAALADRHDPGAAGRDALAAGAPAREPAAAGARPGRAPVYSVQRSDGRRVAVSVPPRNATCGSCGGELPGMEQEGFCPACGLPADGSAPPAPSASASGPTPGARRSFIQLSRAWYRSAAREGVGPPLDDEVRFSFIDEAAGVAFEAAVQWVTLRRGELPSARVVVWDDAFQVFTEFAPFFAELARLGGRTATPGQVVDLLLRLGLEDDTPETPPAHVQAARGDGPAGGDGRGLRRTRPGRSRGAGGASGEGGR